MLRPLPRIPDVSLDPELASLAVLDAALEASRTALLAEHPDAGSFQNATDPLPPLVVLAGLLVMRADELLWLLGHYRRAVEEFRARQSQLDIPF